MNKRNPKTGYAEYYMDESKKPTDAISRAGRFGDDRIGIVDGEPAHINAWEEYLMETHGEIGEDIVKHIGSNTINPETGQPEYFLGKLWDNTVGKHGIGGAIADSFLGDIWDNTLGVDGLAGAVSDIPYVGDATDWLFGEDSWLGSEGPMFGSDTPPWRPMQGSWGIFGQTPDAAEHYDEYGTMSPNAGKNRQAKKVMGGAIDTLQGQLDYSLGSEGSIAQEGKLERQGLAIDTGNAITSINQKQDEAMSKGGFATMGVANQQFDYSDALRQTESSYLGEEKSRMDLISGIQKELNSMMMEYTTATDKTYSSGDLNKLQEQLEQLRG